MKSFYFFLLFLFFLFSGPLISAELVQVQVSRLNLRSSPDRNSSVVMVLDKGEYCHLLEEKDGWVLVRVNGKEGYLRDRSIYIRKLDLKGTDLEGAKKEKAGLESEIKSQEKLLSGYKKQEKNLITGLNVIDKTLNDVNLKLASIQREQNSLLEQRRHTRDAMAELEKENRSHRGVVGQRLRAFYKMESIGRFALLTAADNIYDFTIYKRALENVLSLDDKILGEQGARLKELALLTERLKKEEHNIAEVAQKAAEQLRIQNIEKKKRKLLLDEIRQKQEHSLALVAAFEEFKLELDDTIKKLSRKKSLVRGNFAKFKGLLDMPVKGSIISPFGYKKDAKLNVKTFQSGIRIGAERGEPVKALFSGTIAYADWFAGYGNMIIIDHGDHYFSVYAHAEELFKKTGDGVERNEVIATVGDAGSLLGSMLYFEIRQQGKPLDPATWVKKG